MTKSYILSDNHSNAYSSKNTVGIATIREIRSTYEGKSQRPYKTTDYIYIYHKRQHSKE